MELFTRFDGRINRRQWWIGIVILFVGLVVISVAIAALFGDGLIGRFLMLVISLGALWPVGALASRRLHDRGHPLLPRAALFYGPGAVLSILNAFNIGFRPMRLPDGTMTMMPRLWVSLLGLVSLAALIWAVIELGFREGEPAENAYGPPPG
ncbi:DUF805 domain-containing protein [Rhodobaculum claviforme]|uniref:DUF805 domain-containing protein n=1 Tax=Rhodobaculum claviforme TaxID=1549854 RepID=A0A934WIV2_9RHOB|nr:DUF805 domain-containing protein [Rhodobaculum claviforme]MBK5927346.1 hypothetical protein [Rhodobaculum claviforme]